jgi:hypothetical protein
MRRHLATILVSLTLFGCFTFGDLDQNSKDESDAGTDEMGSDIGASDGDGDTDGDADADADADADTDSDTDADTDVDTDADTDADGDSDITDSNDSDTQTQTSTEPPLDSDLETATPSDGGGDSDTRTETADRDSETDTPSATAEPDSASTNGSDTGDVIPTDVETDSETETETQTETETETETETTTCDGEFTCADWGFQCGTVIDGCGNELVCDECAPGYQCNDLTNLCEPCNTSERCGMGCNPCTDPNLPACEGPSPAESQCVCETDTNGGDSCGGETSRCVDGACEACIDDDACGEGCQPCADPTRPACQGATAETARCICEIDTDGDDSCGSYNQCIGGTCEPCDNDNACGAACENCTETMTPRCDMTRDNGTCVECLSDEHCQNGDVPPFNSELGICTPDRTCTCWVPGADLIGNCVAGGCPGDLICAQDLVGQTHFACMRPCISASPVPPADGITCENRLKPDATTELVWGPVTTCFAFNRFGDSCTENNQCRAIVSATDGSCEVFGTEEWCSYRCDNNSECPAEHSCDVYCVP